MRRNCPSSKIDVVAHVTAVLLSVRHNTRLAFAWASAMSACRSGSAILESADLSRPILACSHAAQARPSQRARLFKNIQLPHTSFLDIASSSHNGSRHQQGNSDNNGGGPQHISDVPPTGTAGPRLVAPSSSLPDLPPLILRCQRRRHRRSEGCHQQGQVSKGSGGGCGVVEPFLPFRTG